MAPRRPPDILRKSHAHTEGKARARSKRDLLDELTQSEATGAPAAVLLIGLAGVIYDGDRAIPGASDAIAWLRRHAIKHFFISDPSFTSPVAAAQALQALGLPVREQEILESSDVAVAAESAWVISDDIRTGIANAQEAGLKGILVKTGRFRAGDLGLGIEPALVLDSIADLPAHWGTNDLHTRRDSG